MAKIGYLKLGRSMPLDPSKWGFVGGDDEPVNLLKDLARGRPDDQFILVGRNSGEKPSEVDLPENVSNPWTDLLPEFKKAKRTVKDRIAWFDQNTIPMFRELDGLIVWLGQHGTSNTPIPPVGSDWGTVTKPQDAFVLYGSYGVRGINAFRQADPINREEVHLIADARNYLKARDLKWPIRHPVLGQYDFTANAKHERYGDSRSPQELGFTAEWEGPHVWTTKHRYVYSRLEICGIMPWHIDSAFSTDWDRRHFGLFINEARAYVKWNRLDALTQYVLPLEPAFIHGKWSAESLEKIGRNIVAAPWEQYYPLLRSVRCTFTTPSSGSGWATTKPWQAFAVGTVCFFHPQYDTQNNILRDADPYLQKWLRIKSPADLKKRVEHLQHDNDAWLWLITEQRKHYDKAVAEARHIAMINERIPFS